MTQHARFASVLDRFSVAAGIKYKSGLVDRLGFPQRRVHQWMTKAVRSTTANLKSLAAVSGNAEFLSMR